MVHIITLALIKNSYECVKPPSYRNKPPHVNKSFTKANFCELLSKLLINEDCKKGSEDNEDDVDQDTNQLVNLILASKVILKISEY